MVFVGWQFGPYGGMETRIVAAARLAQEQGYAVEIVTARPLPSGSAIAGALDELDVTTRSALGDWQATRRGAAVTWSTQRLARLARRGPTDGPGHRRAKRVIATFWRGRGASPVLAADVVHLFGPPMPFTVEALEVAAAAKVPVLYQAVHEVTADYAANLFRRGFTETCNRLDVLMLSHQAQGAGFREHYRYRGPSVVVAQWAYGIEDDLLAIGDRAERPDGQVVVGALCRLDAVKGLDVLIEAFAVAASHPGLRLRIGGTGEETDRLREIAAARGIADRVELVGFVEDRAAFYRDIDVFAISSRHEGGPVTGVEAMAAGLPVVSTTVGAMAERLADGAGLLVEIDDVDAMARALIELGTDHDRRRAMGSAARARYLAQYREAVQQRRMIDLWQRLADQRPA